MLVNEWVDTVWNVVNVGPKTLHDYKRLYKRHLTHVICSMSLDQVDVVLQTKLISLPPQTARHCLMLVKTYTVRLSYIISLTTNLKSK